MCNWHHSQLNTAPPSIALPLRRIVTAKHKIYGVDLGMLYAYRHFVRHCTFRVHSNGTGKHSASDTDTQAEQNVMKLERVFSIFLFFGKLWKLKLAKQMAERTNERTSEREKKNEPLLCVETSATATIHWKLLIFSFSVYDCMAWCWRGQHRRALMRSCIIRNMCWTLKCWLFSEF